MSETDRFKDLEAKHTNTIKDVEKLQELEKYMFQNLQEMRPDGSDAMKHEAILNKINELKHVRTSLLKQISSMYKDKQSQLNSERIDLSDKITQSGIIESELSRARKNVGILENDRDNKLRMAKLYEYERKRYSAYTDMMKIIVFVCIVILALVLLIKYNPIPFIPSHVYSMLIPLSITIGIILIVRKVLDINKRNNLDFDKYDFNFDPSKVKSNSGTIYKHDMNIFKNLENELSNITQNLGNGTSAGAGVSNGISNDPTSVTKVPGGNAVVMPSESSKETFASIN